MRVVVQRVSRASVTVAGETVGEIGPGLVALTAFTAGDDHATVRWMAEKLAGLRVFADDSGRMNRSVIEVDGEALVVSQFTLYGDAAKGRRPSFVKAAPPDLAEPLYESFVEVLASLLVKPVQTGRFGAVMDVALANDGPVTLILER